MRGSRPGERGAETGGGGAETGGGGVRGSRQGKRGAETAGGGGTETGGRSSLWLLTGGGESSCLPHPNPICFASKTTNNDKEKLLSEKQLVSKFTKGELCPTSSELSSHYYVRFHAGVAI